MKRWPRRLVLSCVLFVGCGGAATPELQLVEDAAEAMGSLRTVRETTGVLLEGQGRTYRLGQNMRPRADLPFYEVENYQLQVDFANQRWQVRLHRFHRAPVLQGAPREDRASGRGSAAPDGSKSLGILEGANGRDLSDEDARRMVRDHGGK